MAGLKKNPTLKKKKSIVNFKEDLVTGVSQPMTNDQHWILYYFEHHAHDCDDCKSPYKVLKNDNELCQEGLIKAYAIAKLLLKLRKDGHVYLHSAEEHQYIRIEVPKNYVNCLQLLKAIRIFGKGIIENSYDRTFNVQPRIDRQQQQQPQPQPQQQYQYEVRQPSEPVPKYEPVTRRVKPKKRHPKNSARKTTGSLTQHDLEEEELINQRESRYRYDDTYQFTPRWYQEQSYQYQQYHNEGFV
jgi:hypothetical protein